ncbi:uncharacterized protein B0J16DRAFT_225 [Fusarium flagelliforme]|uniref:DUF7580 domain-containing protein n=1 Tax=Fusarium flagelliforme TaxID=2675880 RepID=A0A395MC77_9HYPO|nr:uncharacterized protein B0J16DRAFT_225 [Fusarium flagelliforme]KAH7196352.1 hypothetical protein B0J16DRAFT_225 [Fusarium flagelliforme]RFN45465.1 hypothetical protein FIE12Z_10331 [Fusarium flagelliforme]
MSGFEVVGVVLGVLPLAIEALKSYRAILSRIRSADRDLRALIQDLETERVRLQTTCEVLLDGIAPLSRIDDIVNKPFGPEWKQFDANIRGRLWTSMDTFRDNAREMQEAAEELSEKLGLNADNQTKLNSTTAILDEYRKRASFSLRKRDYETIISRIKAANSVMRDLADDNRKLEPSRKRRSQTRVTKLLRGLSQSIFDALKTAVTCGCVHPHDLCLELVPRTAVLVPTDAEDELATRLNFHLMLGSYESSGNGTKPSVQITGGARNLERLHRWDSFRLQLQPSIEPNADKTSSLTIPSSESRPKSPRPRVRFSGIFGSSSKLESTSSKEAPAVGSRKTTNIGTPLLTPTTALPVLSADLCQAIAAWHKGQKNLEVPCCGYIADPHRTFGLYPQSYYPAPSPIVTLRHLLMAYDESREYDLLEKLRVALAISMNILYLYTTPWLARILSLDDIVFFQESQKTPVPSSTTSSTGTFVKVRVETVPSEALPSRTHRKASNPILLSLGAMLIQIMTGRPEPALAMTTASNADLAFILEKRKAGLQLRDKVLEEVGENYLLAVEWCLNNVLGIMGLEDEEFCQSFYEGVILRLEKDIQQLSKCY